MGSIWDEYLTDLDRSVYAAAGFGHRSGFGTRPAILIIDVQYRTCGETPKPIMEAIKEYKTSCGETGWAAVGIIEQLLALARPRSVPIIYPVVERKLYRRPGNPNPRVYCTRAWRCSRQQAVCLGLLWHSAYDLS
jgi:hypothetical protein